MPHSAIAVFTAKTVKRMLELGGSRSWLLNPRNARQQQYLVCVRNARGPDPTTTESHGSAFMVGEISGLVRLPEQKGVPRWHISISSYALIDQPDVWKNRRNPVRYTTLEDLGIDIGAITFMALAPSAAPAEPELQPAPKDAIRKLTLAEAKEGLAAMFGVSADAIEITIRG